MFSHSLLSGQLAELADFAGKYASTLCLKKFIVSFLRIFTADCYGPKPGLKIIAWRSLVRAIPSIVRPVLGQENWTIGKTGCSQCSRSEGFPIFVCIVSDAGARCLENPHTRVSPTCRPTPLFLDTDRAGAAARGQGSVPAIRRDLRWAWVVVGRLLTFPFSSCVSIPPVH